MKSKLKELDTADLRRFLQMGYRYIVQLQMGEAHHWQEYLSVNHRSVYYTPVKTEWEAKAMQAHYGPTASYFEIESEEIFEVASGVLGAKFFIAA